MKNNVLFPNGNGYEGAEMDDTLTVGNSRIDSPKELGKIIRAKRLKDGLTQDETASLCGVGTRFISDLENGKATIELGKAIQVMNGLGLELLVSPRGWPSDKRAG